MVLARVATFFINGDATNNLSDSSRRNVADNMSDVGSKMADAAGISVGEEEIDDEAARPPYLHVRMPSRDGLGLN